MTPIKNTSKKEKVSKVSEFKTLLRESESTFLKLGNVVYTLNKVCENGLDLEQELRDFYAGKYSHAVEGLGEGLVSELDGDRQAQLDHMRRYRDRGTISIPPDLYGKPVIYYGNHVMETRSIVYSPNEAVISGYKLRPLLAETTITRLLEPDGVSDGLTYLVEIKPLFAIPLLVAYNSKTNRLYTPLLRTIHSFSGLDVCTGHYSASDWWALGDESFQTNMNRLNFCSPASDHVEVGGVRYGTREFINTGTVLSIARRESVTWSTQ